MAICLFPAGIFAIRTHDVLNQEGEAIKYAYFMNSGVASVLNVMRQGKTIEVGLTGTEGFVGLPLLGGFQSSPTRVTVQIEGSALRMSASALVTLLKICPMLGRRMYRYSQVLAMQACQMTACNTFHNLNERMARWLLMSQDRIGTQRVQITQEALARLLGTRRSTVTVAASFLQKTGLIENNRGSVNIVNRRGLERAACECYGALVQRIAKWDGESSWCFVRSTELRNQ